MSQSSTDNIVLYGCWRSTCTHRVTLALHYHGFVFDYIPVDLGGREQEEPEFLGVSPDAQVPVLSYRGTWLSQSLAIISLLDGLATGDKPSLIPSDPYERAFALAISERVSSYIQPFTLPGGVWRRLKAHLGNMGAELFEKGTTQFILSTLTENLHGLDRRIGQQAGPFVIGHRYSIADTFIYPQMLGAERLGLCLDEFPNLKRHSEAMAQRDDVAAADPLSLPDAPSRD